MALKPGRPAVRRAGELEDIVVQKRRYDLALAAVLVLTAVAAVVDIVGEPPAGSHPREVLFNILYNVLASLFTTALIGRIVVVLAERAHVRRHRPTLALLGIDDPVSQPRVVVVLPAFGQPPRGKEPWQVMADTDPQSDEKPASFMGATGYSFRDVAVVTSLSTVVARAGLPPPAVVSDKAFMEAATGAAGAGRGTIRVVPDGTNTEVTVSHLVVVGHWSNIVTRSLQRSPARFPVRFVQREGEREKRWWIEYDDGAGGTKEKPTSEFADADGTVAGTLTRLTFPGGLRVTVLGGGRGLATQRLGELIEREPAACRALWEGSPDRDLWAVVPCPGDDGSEHDFGEPTIVSSPRRRYTTSLADTLAAGRSRQDERPPG